MPNANDYRAAAIRLDELASRLIHDANELVHADPHRLGGEGPGFVEAAAAVLGVSARLRVGARALADLASTCRDRAVECDTHPVSVGTVSTPQRSRSW